VLTADGKTDDAAEALEQALERYERKRNLRDSRTGSGLAPQQLLSLEARSAAGCS
jgi:hypothetical protein